VELTTCLSFQQMSISCADLMNFSFKGVTRLRAKRKEARESRQRHCKSAGQEEARESHHILPECKKV
jgi:hypothetical protein